jgi:hypothetical protein
MNSLFDNPWPALVAWLAVYLADYYLTLYSARLYRAGANAHFAFEGSLKLTPYYRADIDALRRVSPRFILALVFSVLVIELVWYLSQVVVGLPAVFEFLVGGLLLREAGVLLRHARNIALFRAIRAGTGTPGVEGQVRYARWLSLRLSAVEILSFAAFLALLAPVTASWFVAGGAFACAVTGIQHWRRSRKA